MALKHDFNSCVTDGPTYRRTDGRTDRHTLLKRCENASKKQKRARTKVPKKERPKTEKRDEHWVRRAEKDKSSENMREERERKERRTSREEYRLLLRFARLLLGADSIIMPYSSSILQAVKFNAIFTSKVSTFNCNYSLVLFWSIRECNIHFL